MRIKAELYPPAISKHLSTARGGPAMQYMRDSNPYSERPFVFRGLITCFAAHGDLKKVRHVYLICYDPEDPSKKCLCRTDEVLEQVVKVFRSM
jgi:hypothetical protein